MGRTHWLCDTYILPQSHQIDVIKVGSIGSILFWRQAESSSFPFLPSCNPHLLIQQYPCPRSLSLRPVTVPPLGLPCGWLSWSTVRSPSHAHCTLHTCLLWSVIFRFKGFGFSWFSPHCSWCSCSTVELPHPLSLPPFPPLPDPWPLSCSWSGTHTGQLGRRRSPSHILRGRLHACLPGRIPGICDVLFGRSWYYYYSSGLVQTFKIRLLGGLKTNSTNGIEMRLVRCCKHCALRLRCRIAGEICCSHWRKFLQFSLIFLSPWPSIRLQLYRDLHWCIDGLGVYYMVQLQTHAFECVCMHFPCRNLSADGDIKRSLSHAFSSWERLHLLQLGICYHFPNLYWTSDAQLQIGMNLGVLNTFIHDGYMSQANQVCNR